MAKTIMEVGMLLDSEKDIEFYNEIVTKHGAVNVFNCETHDLYWTNKKYDELKMMTENQIKMSCVRFRMSNGFGGTCFGGDFSVTMSFQNFKIFDSLRDNDFKCSMDEFKKIQEEMEAAGWYLVFDTFKVDYQYKVGDSMQSALQFQEIDKIGLVLYYDNPEYYEFEPKRQREALIDELNSYGMEFKYEDLGIDKLRTLLTGESCFSENQNG